MRIQIFPLLASVLFLAACEKRIDGTNMDTFFISSREIAFELPETKAVQFKDSIADIMRANPDNVAALSVMNGKNAEEIIDIGLDARAQIEKRKRVAELQNAIASLNGKISSDEGDIEQSKMYIDTISAISGNSAKIIYDKFSKPYDALSLEIKKLLKYEFYEYGTIFDSIQRNTQQLKKVTEYEKESKLALEQLGKIQILKCDHRSQNDSKRFVLVGFTLKNSGDKKIFCVVLKVKVKYANEDTGEKEDFVARVQYNMYKSGILDGLPLAPGETRQFKTHSILLPADSSECEILSSYVDSFYISGEFGSKPITITPFGDSIEPDVSKTIDMVKNEKLSKTIKAEIAEGNDKLEQMAFVICEKLDKLVSDKKYKINELKKDIEESEKQIKQLKEALSAIQSK